MADPITRTVHFLSAIHQTGFPRVSEMRNLALSKRHFPKFLGFVVFSSSLSGYVIMDYVQRKRLERRDEAYISSWEQANDNNKSTSLTTRTMSANEAMTRAMIENAKSSSLEENLKNASVAQENFMSLGGVAQENNGSNEFLDRLSKRSEEIQKQANNGKL